MKTRSVLPGVLLLSSGLGVCLVTGIAWYLLREPAEEPFAPSQEVGAVVPVADYRLSGPYTHNNLSVYIVHGPDHLQNKSYLTLGEALEQKLAVVHETGDVSELSIENLSPDADIYLQSGDIVKGGKQDRTFPYDCVVGPRSGKVPVESFCVEQGRWTQRGEESSYSFSSSSDSLSSNGLKNAAKSPKERQAQSEVWGNVSRLQSKLSDKLGEPVESYESKSSLQLTLENPKLQKAIAPYIERLSPTPEGKPDAIGVVVVLNGRVVTADVYGSAVLFRKLWPKLLRAAAIEAFAEEDGRKFSPAGEQEVRKFLEAAERGRPMSEAVTERVYVLVRESDGPSLFETCDRGRGNVVIHRNFLAR